MDFSDLHTGPGISNVLPDPDLSRGEDDYLFRTRQLEGELSVQSKLTAELEQSNAQLLQQIFQANQTRIQLQQRCSYLYDMARAQLKEKKGNNEEITLLRGQLHELRGQHQRLLEKRLEPVASLPDDPGMASKPDRQLQMVRLPDTAAWVGLYGSSMTAKGLNRPPRNGSFQNFELSERPRVHLSRSQSSDLSPEEKEAIKTRMLTDRGPGRRSSGNESPLSPYDTVSRESENQALPKPATGLSRGVKVEPGARSLEVDASLLSHHGNGTPQGEPASAVLPNEDCAVRLRGTKGWRVGVNHEMKKEEEGVEENVERPATPPSEDSDPVTSDSEDEDQGHEEQPEGRDCEEVSKAHVDDATVATPPASLLPADNEAVLTSTASHAMDVASADVATPFGGVLSESVEPHGPVDDSRTHTDPQPTVQQGPPVAAATPTSGGAAVYQDASAEGPAVLSPSPAAVAEPEAMEVVASSGSADARVSSDQSNVLSVPPPSVSSFRRNTDLLLSNEPRLDSTMQINQVVGCRAKETTMDSKEPPKSVEAQQANVKALKTESCSTVEDVSAPLAPDDVLDRYQYTTFCSACRDPRVEEQAVALCQLCPRIFCGLCAAGLGQNVSPMEGAPDVLLSGENCVCLQRDSEFPKPPKGVGPEAHLLKQLLAHDLSLQFREEVAVYDNPGYLGVITRSEMMDFGTMKKKMQRSMYTTTRGQGMFRRDVNQIWLNCRKFAGCSRESTAPVPGIVACASILERMVGKFAAAYMENQEELVEDTAGHRIVRHQQFTPMAHHQSPACLAVPEIPRTADGFEEFDEETESEPEPEMVDKLQPADPIAGRKRKATSDVPSVGGIEICSETGRPQGRSVSPVKAEPADNLCSLAGIGEKMLRRSG